MMMRKRWLCEYMELAFHLLLTENLEKVSDFARIRLALRPVRLSQIVNFDDCDPGLDLRGAEAGGDRGVITAR